MTSTFAPGGQSLFLPRPPLPNQTSSLQNQLLTSKKVIGTLGAISPCQEATRATVEAPVFEGKTSSPRRATRSWGSLQGIRHLGSGGFTLVELLTAVVIAAILIAAGMPTLLGTIERSRLNAAARQVVSEIRKVQSLAVTRRGVFGFHWGGDPNVTGLSATQYRIERDATGACAWPPAGASKADPNLDVITDWLDLAAAFPGVTITAVKDNNNVVVGGVIFDAIGASVNTCTAVAFPLTVTVADNSGATRTIEVRSAGSVNIQ